MTLVNNLNKSVLNDLNDYLRQVTIKPSSDVDEFEFAENESGEYIENIDDMEDVFENGDVLYKKWYKLRDKIILHGEFLQIYSPLRFYIYEKDIEINVEERTHVMYSKPKDITVLTLLELCSKVLYDSFPVDKKGSVEKISVKYNKYGIIFVIHAMVY